MQCLLLVSLSDGGKFWHISDLHLDYEYVPGGDSRHFCHQSDSNQTDDWVGPLGNYSCDSPFLLVESSLQAMQRHQPEPDFIVWTGDSAPHWRDPQPPDQNYITNVTKFVFSRLDKMFPNIPVVPALGNHDSSPPDQFPISVNNSHQEYYKTLWSDGAFGDHVESQDTFLQCGYHSKTIQSVSGLNMTFLVLNTNIYYHDNFTTEGDKDPCGQLSWLEKSLKNVDEDKEKVFIVAHVPPGSFERSPGKLNFNSPPDTFKDINDRYIEIVSRPDNSRKISAHLYGHLHTDTFRILLDGATRTTPVGVAFMAASVTPILWVQNKVVGVNPTIRLMEYNDNGILLDYTTYYLDLKKQFEQGPSSNNEGPENRRTNAKFLNHDMNNKSRTADETLKTNASESLYDVYWKPLYSARETYKLENISASSMFQAYVQMVEAEGDSFSHYYKFNTGSNEAGSCDQSCVRNHLCTISNLVLRELSSCLANDDSSINYYYRTSGEQNMSITTKAVKTSTEAMTLPTTMSTTSTISGDHNENDHSHDSPLDHEETPTSTENEVTIEKIEVSNN